MTLGSGSLGFGLTASALLVLSACQGQVLGPDGPEPSPGNPVGGGPTTEPDVTSGPSDEELHRQDPELFEVALKYFPGQQASAPKKRLFRLTRPQLDSTTESLLPGKLRSKAASSLPRDPLQTNYEYAENLGFGAASFTPFTAWVDAVSEAVKQAPDSVIACDAADASCLEQSAKAFVRRAFRGVLSDADEQRYATFFKLSVAEVGLAAATADLVNVTLTSPSYVFREEVQTDASGRLAPPQLLQHLSYALTDSPPEAVGLPPAGAELSDEELARTVDTLLGTTAARDKLLRFFTAWLEVREPQDLDISSDVFPELTPEVATAMVDDTRRFLARQLGGALPVLRDVTEATEALASAPTAFLYGLAQVPADGRITPPPQQRLGIFTQPAVIASHSGPTSTRLVKRGVFFTRKVMCLPLGVPPAGVDTTIPEGVTGTERERIESVTSPARCAGCHAFINPFGFMQESYDAIGRFRTEDTAGPIDTNISVDFLDEGPFRASSAVEALRGFTRSLRFQQCFTRQLFRFYSGRDEQPGDDPLLRQLFFELARDDSQQIVTLLRSLATSKSFNARTEAP
jgi:Protein of unknown function (DUF1588)/Protein of unknown function (DUF1592)/Protein of unknown function (DUF1585)